MILKVNRIFWVIAVIIITSLSMGTNSQGSERTEVYEGLQLFGKAFSLIRTQYVEKVDTKKLIYGAIEGMLNSLGDTHTRFLRPEVYKEMKVETEGSFSGLGIVIGIKHNKLMVISPIEGTPADLAGVKAGDHIMEIDGVTTKNITLFDAVHKLRGPEGTKVTITIKREGVDKPFKITITRGVIQIKSVKFDVIEPDIGYLRITNFNQKTPREVREALLALEKRGIKSLILDLRNDPGGLLESAVKVADDILPENTLIVSISGRRPEMNKKFHTTQKGLHVNYPLVVLINEGSASASEILAGAIKDNKRGLIMGVKSFGKGSVQTLLPLPDNSGIALTTAKYYTPSGVCIHEKGILPDVTVEMPKITAKDQQMWRKLEDSKYLREFAKKYINKKYTDEEIKEFQQFLKEKNIELNEIILRKAVNIEIGRINGGREIVYDLKCDPQLQRAVDILIATRILQQSTTTE